MNGLQQKFRARDRRTRLDGIGQKLCLWVVGATLLLSAQAADLTAWAGEGADIAAHGTPDGVPGCSGCHGSRGEGDKTLPAPRLAALDRVYLAHELSSFADGTRENSVMTLIAQTLPLNDRDAVATYFSELPFQAAANDGEPSTGPLLVAGASLAARGDWARGLSACGQCHADRGVGVGPTFPALAGQPAAYLAGQIRAWQDGSRRSDPLGLMRSVALRMSPADIAAASAYYASLGGAERLHENDAGSTH